MPVNDDEEYIHVRVDPDLKRLAGMASSAEGENLSEYIRRIVREDAERKGIELPAPTPDQ